MSTDIEIIQAGLGNIDELIAHRMEVIADVFGIPVANISDELRRANIAYYNQALADCRHLALEAVCDGEWVGCADLCLGRELPSPDNLSGRTAYVMNVYVRPQWRHRGVARRLLRSLLKWCDDADITKVTLETTGAARHMYTASGFTPYDDLLIHRS